MNYIFYCIIFAFKLSPLNWKNHKQKIIKGKKSKAKSVHEACYARMQIMTTKGTTRGTFRVDFVKKMA